MRPGSNKKIPGRRNQRLPFTRLVDRESEAIEAVLAQGRGRISGPDGAAVKLQIPRTTLESKIGNLRINKRQFRSE